MGDNISRQAALAYPLSWEHYDKEHGDRKFICGVESYREYIEHLLSVDEWTPCSERLPECEQEVLICTEKKLVGKEAYIDSIITPAIYEDGTMLEVASMWSWYDMDFDEWDDTEDCGIIPMGWFEDRHFNPDEVYNCPIDSKVVAWMPLPEPYKGGDTNAD